MKKLSIVRFRNDHATILDIEKNKGVYTFLPPIELDELTQLSTHLVNRTKILIFFSPLDTIEESIALPSVIKNEATILKALSVKLHDERLINEPLVLNKVDAIIDPLGESIQHHYKGLYEREIYDAISPLTQWEHIDAITSEVYALFSISEEIFRDKSYLSVYTQEDRNLIVAVNNGTLLFSRVGELQSTDEIERVMEQISDINRTVAYAHQQYREVAFEFIAISGNIADGEMATIQLQAITGLRVCTLAPTLMVKGLELSTAQNYILDIGMLYLPESMNFLPARVKAIKEFDFGTKIVFSIALLVMVLGVYFSFSAYTEYQAGRDDYHNTRAQLEQTLQNTVTFDNDQLQKAIALLEVSTEVDHHFLDSMIVFDDLFSLIHPSQSAYSHTPEGGVLTLSFSKKCTTLKELYLFEKTFKQKIATLKPQLASITPLYKINYDTLTFEATVTYGITQQTATDPQQGDNG